MEKCIFHHSRHFFFPVMSTSDGNSKKQHDTEEDSADIFSEGPDGKSFRLFGGPIISAVRFGSHTVVPQRLWATHEAASMAVSPRSGQRAGTGVCWSALGTGKGGVHDRVAGEGWWAEEPGFPGTIPCDSRLFLEHVRQLLTQVPLFLFLLPRQLHSEIPQLAPCTHPGPLRDIPRPALARHTVSVSQPFTLPGSTSHPYVIICLLSLSTPRMGMLRTVMRFVISVAQAPRSVFGTS